MTKPAYQLRALSASQAETFDPSQVGGCQRRWYYERVMRLEVPRSGNAQEDGDAGHGHFARYYTRGELPGRARMGKAVRGAIAAGHLPPRAPGQLIESRFDGQSARDAAGQRVSLRASSTLWLGAMPWDGYVDLRFYSAGMITVLDHKFSSDIHTYAKPADQLLSTVQMPVYALDSLRIWPDARAVRLMHHYVSRRGVESFLRSQVVSVERIHQRGLQIAKLVREMVGVSEASSAEHVPGNRKSCHTWSGCPFQSRCTAFKEKPKMNLTEEEDRWLGVFREANGTPAARAADKQKLLSGEECGGLMLDGPGEKVLAAAVGDDDEEPPDLMAQRVEAAARHNAGLTPNTDFGDPDTGKFSTAGPDADAATHFELASAAGALDDDDPFAVFAPVASIPAERPAAAPTCPDCGTELTAENGSQRDGKWTHVRCPARPASAPATGEAGPKCANCPHPAHEGACSGKRGRGQCKCDQRPEFVKHPPSAEFIARVELPKNYGHLPTCVQSDTGKWLCMDGCTAPVGGGDGVTLTVANPGKAPDVLSNTIETKRWSGAKPNPPGNMQRELPANEHLFSTARPTETEAEFNAASERLDALTREREMHRRTLGELDASERELKRLREVQRPEGAPIPMLLWCPSCHARHVDTGDFADKPHHTHACQACGLAWRPAIVPTVGVQFLPGFKDE